MPNGIEWQVSPAAEASLMKYAFFVYVVLCLIGLGIRTTYEILKKNGKVDMKKMTVFVVVFAAMMLMLVSPILMGPLDPWRIHYPIAVRGSGLIVLIAGFGLALGGLVQLRGVENINHLVTNGLFSKIRHPMYTGFILWISGWVIFYGAVGSFLVGIVCVGNILYWCRLEDRQLAAAYGDIHLTYSKRTWF